MSNDSDLKGRQTGREVRKPNSTTFPFGFRTGQSNEVLVVDFLDDKGPFVEVISSIALDRGMAVDLKRKLDEFISDLDESSLNGND